MNRPDARLVMRLHRATQLAVLACQKMLAQVPEEHQERYVIFHEQGCCGFHDPIEADPTYSEILTEVNAKAEAFMESQWKLEREQPDVEIDPMKKILRRIAGDCFWSTKKRLLSESYGIDWRTPEELTRLMYRLRS